jgi:hypothetical protein
MRSAEAMSAAVCSVEAMNAFYEALVHRLAPR